MREPFHVHVEGIGDFVFRDQTIRDGMGIVGEMSKLLRGADLTQVPAAYARLAEAYATILVRLQSAPKGWVLGELPGIGGNGYSDLLKVFSALEAEDQSFLKGLDGEQIRPTEGEG